VNKILCDGDFDRAERCSNTAIYLARSDIDPIVCVYYCCEEHRDGYEQEGFIIERV